METTISEPTEHPAANATTILAIEDASDRSVARLKLGMKDFGDLTALLHKSKWKQSAPTSNLQTAHAA